MATNRRGIPPLLLRDVGVEPELLDATTAQFSGAMNEAALWVAQHADATTARTQAHAALDRLIASHTA